MTVNMKISINKKILAKNEEFALQNKAFFAEKGILCINMISSPGSGKTTILSRTAENLKDKLRLGVIEGDIQTDTDAAKIRAMGIDAVQIETKGSCHLSAEQVGKALSQMKSAELDIVFVENVGNLVCPSSFDLGEQTRVVVLSVPEGDDKPIKYPGTFAKADILLINKIDLANYVNFKLERVIGDVRVLNPDVTIFEISATTGEGMQAWYDWLLAQRKQQ